MQQEYISYALNQNDQLVKAVDALREDQFHCLECGSKMILRRGEVKRPHFAHESLLHCGGEGVTHLAAKRVLREYLSEHKQVRFVRHCACTGCQNQEIDELDLPAFDLVVEEQPFGEFRLDLALLKATGELVLGIEVYSTSRVSRFKALQLSLPWIEMDAQVLLEDAGYWSPLQLNYDTIKDYEKYSRDLRKYKDSLGSKFSVHPRVKETVIRYLQARFSLKDEAMRPHTPWLCDECLAEMENLKDLLQIELPPLSEKKLRHSFTDPHLEKEETGRTRKKNEGIAYDLIRAFLPEMYQDTDIPVVDPTQAQDFFADDGTRLTVDELMTAKVHAKKKERDKNNPYKKKEEVYIDPQSVLPGVPEYVITQGELQLYSTRKEDYKAALSFLKDYFIDDLEILKCLMFVPQRYTSCGCKSLMVWTKEEVFYADEIEVFLSPVDPPPPQEIQYPYGFQTTLPPQGIWEARCPECGAAQPNPNLHWKELLPGRVLADFLRGIKLITRNSKKQ